MSLTLPQYVDFSLNGNEHILRINKDILVHFQQNRQDHPLENEVGGQLFGVFEGKKTIICCATGPRKIDKRGKYFFRPARWLEQYEIKKKFKQGVHYIGDWHTHPEETPTPSFVDIASMEDCFRRSDHELASFILVIVGQATFPQGLWVSGHQANGYKRMFVLEKS